MKKSTNWVAIAFVNREKEEKTRREANRDLESQISNPNRRFFERVRDRIIEYFLKKQKYVHIELAFPCETSETKGECEAYGVWSNCGLDRKIRTFSNPSYEWVILCLSDSEMEKLRTFCDIRVSYAKSRMEHDYDDTSLFMSQIWPITRKHRYWCVSFVVKALQEIGLFRYYTPETFTIDEAVAYLKEHNKVIYAIPPILLRKHKVKLTETTNNEKPYYELLFE